VIRLARMVKQFSALLPIHIKSSTETVRVWRGKDMDSPITYLATLVGALVLLLVLTGGNFHRFGLALSCFRKVARDAPFAEAVQRLLVPPPKKDEPPPKPSGAPLRLLALLQRE